MFKEPRNRFQGIDSASLCGLAGRYDKYDKPARQATVHGLLKRLQILAIEVGREPCTPTYPSPDNSGHFLGTTIAFAVVS
jgi:hypothetical protein